MTTIDANFKKKPRFKKSDIPALLLNLEPHTKNSPFVRNIIRQAAKCKHIVIDGLAGWGGVTGGFFKVPSKNWYVVACINHSPVAIYNHALSYPNCLHLLEDFRTADLSLIAYIIEEIRKINPDIEVHGWFSFDCTNFSNAKGGMPRDADSRSLAEHIDIYIKTLGFDHIWVENVKEFLMWGPMIAKTVITDKGKRKQLYFSPDRHNAVEFFEPYINAGTNPMCMLERKKVKGTKQRLLRKWEIPDPPTKGKFFQEWLKRVEGFGYESDYKLLNCADFGVPQHRVRLIMQFKKGFSAPFAWPAQTHDKKGRKGLPKWVAVRTVLDLEDEGESVLDFKKDKHGEFKVDKHGNFVPRISSPKSIARLIKGTVKHVILKNQKAFFTQAYSGDDNSKTPGIDQPSRAITATGGNLQLNSVETVGHTEDSFLMKYMGNNSKSGDNNGTSLNDTSPTISTQNRLYLAKAHHLSLHYGSGQQDKSINEVAPAVPTKDPMVFNTVQYLDKQYTGSDNHQSLEDAAATITSNPPHSLISSIFVDQAFSGGGQSKSMEEPSCAITRVQKQSIVNVEQFVMPTGYDNEAKSLEDTAPTVTANRKHHYIISAQFNNLGKSIEETSATILACMDKKPPYLVITEFGELAIEVYSYDPPHYVELKKFMAENGIVRINMRMLTIRELMRIQTLDEDRPIEASATDCKMMIGNAVPSWLVVNLAMAHEKTAVLQPQLKFA